MCRPPHGCKLPCGLTVCCVIVFFYSALTRISRAASIGSKKRIFVITRLVIPHALMMSVIEPELVPLVNKGTLVMLISYVYSKQPIFGLTQEWFRELSFSSLECYTFPEQTGGIFYLPWHSHQIEGTNGFECLVRKTHIYTIYNVETVFTTNDAPGPGSQPRPAA